MARAQKLPWPNRIDGCLARLQRLLAGWTAERSPVHIIQWVAARPGEDWAAHQAALPGAGILLVVADSDLTAPLQDVFAHVAAYVVRPVEALLLQPVAQTGARVARLHQRGAPGTWLLACSDQPAPPLPQGLLEPDAPLAAPAAPAALAAPMGQLAGLAERLMAMEQQLMAAHLHAAQLEYRLSRAWPEHSGSGQSGYFDVPRDRHEWKLAEDPGLDPAALGLYDRRPDDAVILAARAGAAFFARHQLMEETPDFAGAVRELGRRAVSPPLEPARPPEVSIVIPIHGQLAYTLNCLDGLLTHETRHSIEIIVIDDASPDQSAHHLAEIPQIHFVRRPRNGGFIAAVNEAAALARGQFLVLLNNDTRVVAGWLDALIAGFAQFPRAGLVGSKLHYDDGSLQEAGGIIWRDASCWNYGYKDDPNRPQYSHARQADYISGCSVAIRTALWREMDGFDAHFAPAYCEDADLCLRLSARGHEIWFQPASRVVHYEGKTSGTDTSQGVKAYQLVNTKKLYLRWRERLLDHRPNGTAPYFERERKVKRRLLVVDAVAPTPKQDAGSVQTMLAMQVARDLGYKVHFVPEDNWLFEPGAIADLQAMGIDCGYAPFEVGFDNYLRRYGFLFDVILVYRVTIFERTLAAIETFAPQATVLYHLADLHHLRLARQAAVEGDDFLREQAENMKLREYALAQRAHGTITHSRHEAALLADHAPRASVTVWPLMFDYFGTSVGFRARRDVCFLGGYRHPPNYDAVRYFVEDIWPLLQPKLGGARFIIAGANPTPDVLALAAEDVIVTGAIDDLRDLFDAARVFVVPLRVGAGVKGKVMSAMAYGIPVVSTSIGFEGTGLEPGIHLLAADEPADFAAQVLRAYHDEDLWNWLSASAQQVMRDWFSPSQGGAALARAIDQATRRRLGLDGDGAA